jgi:transposase-like protein
MTDDVAPHEVERDQGERELGEQIVDRSRREGLDLGGPDGVLTGLTKKVLEVGLEAELTEHLGYDKHDPAGRNSGNSRNGTRAKTVLTEIGPVPLEVPRDREGSFELLVKKRQRRLRGVDDMVISLTAKGLITGEVSAHLAEVYGANVSRETVSKLTDRIVEEMADWLNRLLEQVYAVVFIDAVVIKVRDGQVTNRPHYQSLRWIQAEARQLDGSPDCRQGAQLGLAQRR